MKRDQRGRFAVGNPGGPGRPPREREREYLQSLQEVCSMDAWRQIAMRAVSDAMEGDAKARDWLSRYLCPQTPIDAELGTEPPPEMSQETILAEIGQILGIDLRNLLGLKEAVEHRSPELLDLLSSKPSDRRDELLLALGQALDVDLLAVADSLSESKAVVDAV